MHLSHVPDARGTQKTPSEYKPIRKNVDKVKETTNKDNEIHYTT
jgi:hypothetical protein